MLSVRKRGKINNQLSVTDAVHTQSEVVLSPDKLPSNLILHLKKKRQIECVETSS